MSAAFGPDKIYNVPLAATLSLPLYINAEASLPLIRALLENGMSQGAALAFLISGAGTSIGAIAGALTIARWRVVALVVAGENDPFYTAGLFRATAAGIPQAKLILYPGMGHPAMGKPFERDVLAFLVERDPPSTDAEHDTVATSIPERRPCIGVGAYVCGSPLRMGARGGPISSP